MNCAASRLLHQPEQIDITVVQGGVFGAPRVHVLIEPVRDDRPASGSIEKTVDIDSQALVVVYKKRCRRDERNSVLLELMTAALEYADGFEKFAVSIASLTRTAFGAVSSGLQTDRQSNSTLVHESYATSRLPMPVASS